MQGINQQLLPRAPIQRGFWSQPSIMVLIASSYAFQGASMAYLLNMIYFFAEEEKKFGTLEVVGWVALAYVLRVIIGLVFDLFAGFRSKKFWCFLAAACISFLCYAYDILIYYEMVGDTLLYCTFALNLSAQALIEVLSDSVIVVESNATRDRGSQLMVFAWIFSNIYFNVSFLLSSVDIWMPIYLATMFLPIMLLVNFIYSWKSALNTSGISCSVLKSIATNNIIWQMLIVMVITAFCFDIRFFKASYGLYLHLIILLIDLSFVMVYYMLRNLRIYYALILGMFLSIVYLSVAIPIRVVEPSMTGIFANSGVGSIIFGFVTLPYLVMCTKCCKVGYEVSYFSVYKFFPNLGILMSVIVAEYAKGIAEEEWQILIKIGLLVISFVLIVVLKEKMRI